MVDRGEVAILAVDDQARFSRADNAFAFIQDVVFHGGRFVSTGEGIDTEQEGWELRVKVMELHNSTTIRELGRRVRRGQKGRVLDDAAAGDHPYVYESYYLDPNWAEASLLPSAPSRKKLACARPRVGGAVGPAGLRVVRRRRDVHRGDRTRADPPGGRQGQQGDHARLAPPAGAPHAGEREVRRPLALGGKTKVLRDSAGRKKQVPVADGQEVVRDRPELRIIDQATWEKAQVEARLRRAQLDQFASLKPGEDKPCARPEGTAPHERLPQQPAGRPGLLPGLQLAALDRRGRRRQNQPHLACPNHSKGTCSIATQVPLDRAEAAVLGLVAEVLTSWPGWVESASTSLRRAVAEAAARQPASIRDNQGRLAELERRIGNLVDQLADGAGESPAFTPMRLGDQLEREAEDVRGRVDEAIRAGATAVAMPDDDWIRAQMAELPALLADEPRRAAPLLRRLLVRIEAEGVVAPGKVRGFARLRLRVDPSRLIEESLGGRLADAASCGAHCSPGHVLRRVGEGVPPWTSAARPGATRWRRRSPKCVPVV